MNSYFLIVGDMHVRRDNLEESQRLIDWIIGHINALVESQGGLRRLLNVIFLGDQFNDFGIARVEVANFWHKNIVALNDSRASRIIFLTGNHDMNGTYDSSIMTCYELHAEKVQIIDSPVINERFSFLPYIKDQEKFEEICKGLKGTVFCHQEINGCQFENGMYAPGGAKLENLPPDLQIISGHIHMQQSFGNVWYPGAPRQITRSDAGSAKSIFVFDPVNNSVSPIMTPPEVSEPYIKVIIKEGEEVMIPKGNKVLVDIHGSQIFIKKVLKDLPDNAIVRTHPNVEQKAISIKESEGIPFAFKRYSESYFISKNCTPDTQDSILKLIYQKCPILKGN
jgi:hypothetical protein